MGMMLVHQSPSFRFFVTVAKPGLCFEVRVQGRGAEGKRYARPLRVYWTESREYVVALPNEIIFTRCFKLSGSPRTSAVQLRRFSLPHFRERVLCHG